MSPCGRLERHRIHAADFRQVRFQRALDLQHALSEALGLVRVGVDDAVDASHRLVETGIVLHRAGAEGIHPGVDGIVPARQPREVADHFNLADLWKSRDLIADVCGTQGLLRIDLRHVQGGQLVADLARRGTLEQEPFFQGLVLADPTHRPPPGSSRRSLRSARAWQSLSRRLAARRPARGRNGQDPGRR